MILPKGPYQGYRIDEVPVGNLLTFLTDENDIPVDLVYAIKKEVTERLHIISVDLGGFNNLTAKRKIEEVQEKYQGSPEALQAINELVENIKPYI